jgi:hypothetical protein
MVKTSFENKQRENPKKGFEHESKRKMPKRETEIKMGTTGYERRHTKGWKNMGRN